MMSTTSAVRMLKTPCAIELNRVKFCSGLYLFEIVLYSFMMGVMVACTKRNVENYIPHSVRM